MCAQRCDVTICPQNKRVGKLATAYFGGTTNYPISERPPIADRPPITLSEKTLCIIRLRDCEDLGVNSIVHETRIFLEIAAVDDVSVDGNN